MGTRADFYVGRGESAEWLGSVAWDGYPDGFPKAFRSIDDEAKWRNAVTKELAGRPDATTTDQGWPWPWDDSGTTDYSYAFDDGAVWASSFGTQWFKCAEQTEPPEGDDGKAAVFPKMKMDKAAPAGSRRSGILVFGG